ncbi:hypothetical protein DSO57_1022136 [Entomophthora muscae]|uniref:Uncharacterized protein n=1 Tax=Entomophthora muscae TaxID=34485 RepID=A0ACC2UCP0_9FUNG|nr:hypothetical protein DSO57_1022136 [Entomophthora muscae]
MIYLTDKSGITNETQLENNPLTTNKKLPGFIKLSQIFILLVLSNREFLQYQCQRWETEKLLAASNQPPPAFTPSPRVLDQEIIPAPAPCLSFPGVSLLQQLVPPSLTMSTATREPPLVPSASSYDYSKLGFAYLIMMGLTEQIIPHMGVWRPWATAANHVMQMTPVIYWAFQAQPFPLTKGSPGSNPGHDTTIVLKVNNNSYLLKGLDKRKQDKVLHHNHLCPCKACQKQHGTILPSPKQKLIQYDAWPPKTFQKTSHQRRLSLSWGVSKQQGQPPGKVSTKQVCDLQSEFPVTCSQMRKSTQISRNSNMSK